MIRTLPLLTCFTILTSIFLVGYFSDPFRRDVIVIALCFGACSAAYDYSAGFAGLRSLGPILPFGLSGYMHSLLLREDVSFLVALPISAVLTAFVGTLLFFIFAGKKDKVTIWIVVGLIASLIFEQLAILNTNLLGGATGLIIPRYFAGEGAILERGLLFYCTSFTILTCVFCSLIFLVYKARGAKLLLSQYSPDRLREIGINPLKVRLKNVFLSWIISAIAGSIFVSTSGTIDPTIFGLENNLTILVAASAMGERTILRPALIALIIVIFENLLGSYFSGYQTLILGLTYIGALYLYNSSQYKHTPASLSIGTHGIKIV